MKNLTKELLEELYSHENLVKIYDWNMNGELDEIEEFVKDFVGAKAMCKTVRNLISDLEETADHVIYKEKRENEEMTDEDVKNDALKSSIKLKCDIHYFLDEIKDIIYSEVRRDTYDEVCNKIKDFEREFL